MPTKIRRNGVWVPNGTAIYPPGVTPPTEASGPYVIYTATAALAPGPTFVMDSTQPDAANSGPAAEGFTNLTNYTGDITVANGQEVKGLYINGYVTVQAGGYLHGCAVRGNSTPLVYPGRSSLVGFTGSTTNPPRIEFNDIGYTTPHHYAMNCIVGSGAAIIRRNNLHDGTDIFKITGDCTGSDVGGNYTHDHSFNNDDLDQPGDNLSHCDHLQVNSATSNLWYHGNSSHVYYSPSTSKGTPSGSLLGAGISLSSATGAVTGMKITKNWFRGGYLGIQSNAVPTSQGSTTVGEVSGNRFSFDTWNGGSGDPDYQIRYAVAYADWIGQLTNYFAPELPGVTAAGLDNQLFRVGTTGRDGIRRG